jgi:hypothetical protein
VSQIRTALADPSVTGHAWYVVKLLVGFLKGAVIGGGIGYGAFALWQATEFSNAWLTFGLVGALVGLLVGKPIWSLLRDKDSTTVVALLKAAFGFGIGCGLYALLAKAWSPGELRIAGEDVFTWQPTVGGAIGAVYGAFVEFDDSIGDNSGAKTKVAQDTSAAQKKLPAKTAKK